MRGAVIAAAVGAVALGAFYVWKKGGVSNAAQAVGAGAVNAVGGVASGAVGAIGGAVGLPTPSQTTTDERVSRWIIDNVGHWEASQWSGAPAYIKALMLPAGSGTPPDPNSAAGREFAAYRASQVTDTGDETERLLGRYPAPTSYSPETIFNGAGSFGAGAGLGLGGFGDLWTVDGLRY